ncbi:ABC transporter permease [bacterium]|nr:ABC transporter permease [bacterium]
MILLSVIIKSIREQLRNYWILLLTISLAPLFVFIYYLIIESSEPQYDLLLLNNDKTIAYHDKDINFGETLINYFREVNNDSISFPLKINISSDEIDAVSRLKNRTSDVLIIIPERFSQKIIDNSKDIEIEFIGDLTNISYMIGAVWANEIISSFLSEVTDIPKQFVIKETSLGISGKADDFQLSVPGLLILSIIMLMFSASMAIISEVENKTMLRLKLSKLRAWEYLSGVGIVQIIVGVIAIFLTLIVAVAMGFDLQGSIITLILIAILTSISIVAFSLIIAALTKTANEILIVGNFPLFLFMFFTGAAFPMKAKALFHVAGYPVSFQGLMSPTHAISALNKIMIMNMELRDIIPEIIALIVITIFYFVVGIWAFQKRHMKVV